MKAKQIWRRLKLPILVSLLPRILAFSMKLQRHTFEAIIKTKMDASKYDALDDFEKQLAEEKASREKEENRASRKDRDHKHRHRHKSHRTREDEEDGGHRRKRSRRDDDDGKHRRHGRHSQENDNRERHDSRRQSTEASHEKSTDPKLDLPLPDQEVPTQDLRSNSDTPAKRDSWMTAPSAMEIDFTQRGAKKIDRPIEPPKPDYDLKIHRNELNTHLEDLADGKKLEEIKVDHDADYTFGDSGSKWRMSKLKNVYIQAEKAGRPIEEIAEERFGSLREFDDAREEQIEVERRKLYGEGYVGKVKPSGELFQERKMKSGIRRSHEHEREAIELSQGQIMQEMPPPTRTLAMDQTALNRLKAQMMKAKLKKSPDAEKLEAEYDQAMASFANNQQPDVIVLGQMNNRMLAGTRGEVKSIDNKRGRERGTVEENDEMTIEDMVREERRTKGQAGGEGQRFAERIAKDAKFDNDLEYMDDNANKLAKRVHKSEINLKNSSVSEFQKLNRILDSCQLCYQEDKGQPPTAPILSLATRVYLTLPTAPELSDGGAVIVPIQHRANLLSCDDDEWEEIRNFMKSLTRMYHDQGRSVIFYENAAAPKRHMHAAMVAVPLPYELGDTAPAFFRESMLTADEEWSQHKKIIDTSKMARNGAGKGAFRRALAKEMPYFHVWTELDGGLAHVVEDEGRWPRGDLFAREIIGGMLDSEPDVIKRQGRWHRGGDERMEPFKKRWRKFDWTRVLTDGL